MSLVEECLLDLSCFCAHLLLVSLAILIVRSRQSFCTESLFIIFVVHGPWLNYSLHCVVLSCCCAVALPERLLNYFHIKHTVNYHSLCSAIPNATQLQ